MNIVKKHSLYFLSVISLIAGFLASVLVSLLAVNNFYNWPATVAFSNFLKGSFGISVNTPLLFETIILSGLILTSGIGFADYCAKSKIRISRMLFVLFLCAIISVLTTLFVDIIKIDNYLLSKSLIWVIMGFLIGSIMGPLKYGPDIQRIALSIIGGVMGGAFGGISMALLGQKIPYLPQFIGFISTSFGILISSAKAVELLNKTELRFIYSAQNEVNEHFKKNIGLWKFHKEEKYLIGNSKNGTVSKDARHKFINIPDILIKPEHVWIIHNTSRFYLRISSSNINSSKNPLGVYYLVDGVPREVQDEFVLENNMHLRVGETEFKVLIKQKN